MVCSSGVGFNPVVDGIHYTFDTFGLYNGLFVMKDRQGGSVWTHYDGSVLSGPLTDSGLRLEIQPIVHTTWAEWTELHPDTLVLDWYPEFSRRYRDVVPGRAGLSSQFEDTLLNTDDRLPENKLVLGVNVGSEFRAYVLSEFGPEVTVINDTLGGIPVVIFIDSRVDFGLAFQASIGDQVLVFSSDGETITDSTGNIWLTNGLAESGPLAGTQLSYATSFVSEWYGWAAYHPETSIYGE